MIIEVNDVNKRFGGLHALTTVSLEIEEGQIFGLIGPNGAGKTTLFNVINGVYTPDGGSVKFRGQDVTGMKPYHLAHKGMARTHQIVRPLNDLTVRENVVVGACFGRQQLSLGKAGHVADEVMEFVGLGSRTGQLAGNLNVAQKKRLELARALAAQPYLLLLDEVLAGLNETEIAQMVDIIQKIRDRGTTIMMIEHVMHAIMRVSDKMLVLDFGKQIASGTPSEVTSDPKVIEAYLGDANLAKKFTESNPTEGEN